jgi:hypothetical protein
VNCRRDNPPRIEDLFFDEECPLWMEDFFTNRIWSVRSYWLPIVWVRIESDRSLTLFGRT